MAVSKEDKKYAFLVAVDITKAYGPGGANKYLPSDVIKTLYAAIKEIKEDVDKS